MIIDHIRNRALYYSLGERVQKALDFMASYAAVNPQNEDIVLDGENVFVKVRPMNTKPVEDCSFEAHKKYADIHFAAKGSERIGYADVRILTEKSYDESKDAMALSGSGDLITLNEGYFMIVLPDDAHMPCVCVDKPSELIKLIAKIKLQEKSYEQK